jgi:hypothetical protein
MPDAPFDEKAMSLFNRASAKASRGDVAGAAADYSAILAMPNAPSDLKAEALDALKEVGAL